MPDRLLVDLEDAGRRAGDLFLELNSSPERMDEFVANPAGVLWNAVSVGASQPPEWK